MLVETILFLISILICGIILYILGKLWFVDNRNRKLHSLFVLGITVFSWTFFNALSMMVTPEAYPFIYTCRMIAVCIVPYCLLWFFLNYSSSNLARSKPLLIVIQLIAAVDILLLVTNPLHHLYFIEYVYPRSVTGPWFWIHTGAAYITVMLCFFILIRYIVRYSKERPSLIWAGVGTVLPYALNIVFTFGIWDFAFDLTPFGFFVAFLIFTLLSYRSRLLNIKTSAFANIFAALKDIILIADTDNVVVDANYALAKNFPDFGAEIGKTTMDEFLSYLTPRVKTTSEEGLLENITKIKDTVRVEGEMGIETPGGLKTFMVNRSVIRTVRRVTGYVLKFSDISEYRAMISEIDQQNKRLTELKEMAESASEAKGAFLANMSHEMRTPMNAIIGMTTIAKSTDSVAKKNECIAKVADASTHLLGVINDVLDMSKIEANKLELVEAEFDLEKMLVHSANFIGYNVKHKGQNFKVRTYSNLPRRIKGDEQRLSQVITNLLSNAVKFTPEGGEITLRARALEDSPNRCVINIEVQDTGIGIDEEHQKNLFSSFQQANSGISRKYGGTGLGLAISKRIVEVAGGEMYLSSTVGQGSTFGFRLPVEKGHEADPLRVLTSSRHLLVADRSPEVRAYFDELSNKYGFLCTTAESEEAALEILDKSEESFIAFIDWTLSGVSALSLAERVRSRGREDFVVMMVSSAERSEAEQGEAEAQTDYFIQKPLFASIIIDVINSCGAGEKAAESPGELSLNGLFEGYRVLLAEDVEINREIVMTLLEPTGIKMDVAQDGNEAVSIFGGNPERYDAIFMDIHMPEKNGYEATREIRAIEGEWARRIPIIAMTANVFNEDIERCIAEGMNDHVGKPIVLEEVIESLKKYLPAHRDLALK